MVWNYHTIYIVENHPLPFVETIDLLSASSSVSLTRLSTAADSGSNYLIYDFNALLL